MVYMYRDHHLHTCMLFCIIFFTSQVQTTFQSTIFFLWLFCASLKYRVRASNLTQGSVRIKLGDINSTELTVEPAFKRPPSETKKYISSLGNTCEGSYKQAQPYICSVYHSRYKIKV